MPRPRPLTPAQERVVRLMREYAARGETLMCAYDLRCSLATLEALKRRGLVRLTNAGVLGVSWFPRNVLLWELTEARRDG